MKKFILFLLALPTFSYAGSTETWDGWYVGGSAGWTKISIKNDDTEYAFNGLDIGLTQSSSASPEKTSSLRLGHNWHINNLVYSIELSFSDIEAPNTSLSQEGQLGMDDYWKWEQRSFSEIEIGRVLDLRGRIGTFITPDLLLYGTAGWMKYDSVYHKSVVSINSSQTSIITISSEEETYIDPVFGLGLEYEILPSITMTIEYLRRKISNQYNVPKTGTFNGQPIEEFIGGDALEWAKSTYGFNAKLDDIDSLTIGFNYHF